MLFFLSVCCRGEVVRCTLWNGYAQQFNDFLAQNNPIENVMAVIQHAKIKLWQDNIPFGMISLELDCFSTKKLMRLMNFVGGFS
ncbi:hypothetical protein Hdeb2414_s0010g00330781 [Helianthus debilis subsp. tardiflorus]